MALSVVDPVNSAIERARRVCFRPFDLGKWFVIGFCAFLAGFAEGGSSVPSFNFNIRSPLGGPGDRKAEEDVRTAIDWIQAHLVPIVVIGVIGLILIIALTAVFAWLGSRGQFMFLDNVVRNRGAVVEPWREYRKEGNSAFWFRFLLILAVLATYLLVVAGAVFIALEDIQGRRFGPAATTGLVVGIAGLLVVAIVAGVIGLFLNDFVVPIMYLRRIGVLDAWREFHSSMLAGHIGTFVLYVLFKIVLPIAVGMLMVLLFCCTLCIMAIPYVGTHVLILPLHVFWRSYSLYFIEQFDPEWRIFSVADVPIVELADEGDEWLDERYYPGEEQIRPGDDTDRPPDDRFRPE
jgi:hypothetical protein